MNINDTHWTLGVLIGVPIWLSVLAAGYLLARKLYRVGVKDDDVEIRFFGWAFAALTTLILVVGLGALFPYGSQYHQWAPKYGTVTKIDKRIIGGDSIEEKFVVTFSGSDQQYGCSDTRCATIQIDDELSLACKRSWEYAATDGWDCLFVDWKKAS